MMQWQFVLKQPRKQQFSNILEFHMLHLIIQSSYSVRKTKMFLYTVNLPTFSHLADAFIQSDLKIRTMEAIKITKE